MKPLYKSEKIGEFDVRTFDVALKKVYITLAFENGKPFDLEVAENEEDALANHEQFKATATLMMEAMPVLKKIAATGEKVTRQDIDSVIHSLMPPDRDMLN